MPDTSDFLEPNSMLTPGLAGGLTVMTTTALYNGFGLNFNWTALIISCLLSFTIVSQIEKSVHHSLKLVYFLLNALIIFSVTQGTSVTINPPSIPNLEEAKISIHSDTDQNLITSYFIKPAYAEIISTENDDIPQWKLLTSDIVIISPLLYAEVLTKKTDTPTLIINSHEQKNITDQKLINYPTQQKAIEKYNKRWRW